MGTVLYIVAACMIWSVVKYFADIIYGPTSLPGAVIAKIPVAVVAVFVLWAGRKLMKKKDSIVECRIRMHRAWGSI